MAKASRAPSSAQTERDRIHQAEMDRADRIRSWGQAHTEGIREGLLMALAAIPDVEAHGPIRFDILRRGDKHFGDQEWRTKPRSK